MSGDPEQEYFADGMVEDIITGLSRIKWLFVIARNSSFIYKGKAVDMRQVGRELGVRYVLEGGVRKAGNRLRVTAQLIEAETGAHLWADRFDGAIDDVFDLQDRITDRSSASSNRACSGRRSNARGASVQKTSTPMTSILRALPHMMQLTPEQVRIGAGLLEDALKLDPNYAAAHALIAWRYEICYGQDGFDEAEKIAGLRHARAAIASTTDDATALAIAAMVIAHLGRDYEAASNAIERALSFNGASAAALYFGAHIYAFRGACVRANDYASRALRLSPFDPWAYEAHVAFAISAVREDRYAEAASHLAQAVQANSSFTSPRFLQAMTLALAGSMEEAQHVVRGALELQPGFRTRLVFEIGLLPEFADKFAEGARLLGLPK